MIAIIGRSRLDFEGAAAIVQEVDLLGAVIMFFPKKWILKADLNACGVAAGDLLRECRIPVIHLIGMVGTSDEVVGGSVDDCQVRVLSHGASRLSAWSGADEV